jgi:hypothetical protein
VTWGGVSFAGEGALAGSVFMGGGFTNYPAVAVWVPDGNGGGVTRPLGR